MGQVHMNGQFTLKACHGFCNLIYFHSERHLWWKPCAGGLSGMQRMYLA